MLAAHGLDNARVQLADNSPASQTGRRDPREGTPAGHRREGRSRRSDHAGRSAHSPSCSSRRVGSSVSRDITRRSFFAVAIASVGILLYIAYAFRNTQNPLLYGICAIVAMLHDVLVVLGIFSILGEVRGVEIDSLFVTALLTIIGFSVHDTIVVFDRIRENLARRVAPTFEEVVNYSLAQTIVRSLNTSMTVVFTLLALYLFGGESTKEFVLALLIGVISGTYLIDLQCQPVAGLMGNRRNPAPLAAHQQFRTHSAAPAPSGR